MRMVILASNTHAQGGIQRYTRDVMRALRTHRHEATLVELQPRGALRKFLFALQSIFIVARTRPDFVWCAHINFGVLSYWIHRVFRVPYALVVYGIEAWSVLSERQKNALRHAKHVVAISEFTKTRVMQQVQGIGRTITLLPNGVHGDEFYPTAKNEALLHRYGLRGKRVVCTLARLAASEQYKGYDTVIRAIPEILRAYPDTVYLLGGSGDDAPRVRALVRELGLEQTVILAGFIPERDLNDFYNLADIFVMPSKGEGFGYVFLEVLACGKPVIAGADDGAGEALLHGALGLCVRAEDAFAVARAIIDVFSGNVSSDLLNGALLRKRVLEAYGFDLFTKRLEALLLR